MKNFSMQYGNYAPTHGEQLSPWQQYIQKLPYMALIARAAQNDHAYSYRDFHVGASLLAINKKKLEMNIYSAGNLKLDPTTDKFCAEAAVLAEAKKDKMTHAIGLVVIGTIDQEQIRDVTGRATPTLHPCASCRNLFTDSRLISSHTLVVTTDKDFSGHQVHTVGQLSEFYKNTKEASDHQVVKDAGFVDWVERPNIYQELADLSKDVGMRIPPYRIAQYAAQATML